MSANDHQALVHWREALLWLAKAEADIIGARTLLAGGQAELAAFHVQKALEKTLKALLVAAAQDVRRTHDIDALATLARTHWPDLFAFTFSTGGRHPVVCHDPLSGPRRVVTSNRGGRRNIGGGRYFDRRRGAAFPAGSCGGGRTWRRPEPISENSNRKDSEYALAQQHGWRGRRRPVGAFRSRPQPRARQHRDLRRRSCPRDLDASRLGADPGQDAPLLRARSRGELPLRRQPGFRHDRDLPRQPSDWPADADRSGRRDRQPGVNHFCRRARASAIVASKSAPIMCARIGGGRAR